MTEEMFCKGLATGLIVSLHKWPGFPPKHSQHLLFFVSHVHTIVTVQARMYLVWHKSCKYLTAFIIHWRNIIPEAWPGTWSLLARPHVIITGRLKIFIKTASRLMAGYQKCVEGGQSRVCVGNDEPADDEVEQAERVHGQHLSPGRLALCQECCRGWRNKNSSEFKLIHKCKSQ